MISLNHKIDCCICSSGSRAFPAGFVQQNLPRLNFVGSSHFFNFTYFFFPEEDNFPLSGKLCDVSNFQLRLHQREFKMVVPPSKVSNFFQRKEISQKLEAFFHSVSSYHRPIIKFPLKKMILNECAARVDYENRKSTDLQQVSQARVSKSQWGKICKSHPNVIQGNRVSNSARWSCDFGWKKRDRCPDKNTAILEMTLLG